MGGSLKTQDNARPCAVPVVACYRGGLMKLTKVSLRVRQRRTKQSLLGAAKHSVRLTAVSRYDRVGFDLKVGNCADATIERSEALGQALAWG
jgi:hypothetical protein